MSRFTRNAIVESFIKLLSEKRLDKITVKDIVIDCGVSRKTFYYYFEDIYDLLEKCLDDLTEKSLAQAVDVESFGDVLLQIAKFTLTNKKAVYNLYRSISRERLEDYLFNSSFEQIKKIVELSSQGIDCKEDDIEILSIMCTNTFVGCVLYWVKNGMKTDFEYVLERVLIMFDDFLKFALKNAAENNKLKR